MIYHQLCYRSALILVLLSLYGNASPVSSVDQNQHQEPVFLSKSINEQSETMEPSTSNINNEILSKKFINALYNIKILCAYYDVCNEMDNNHQQIIDYEDTKEKRLSSSLFHGFPKFGKRAFSSAFAGLPKFG